MRRLLLITFALAVGAGAAGAAQAAHAPEAGAAAASASAKLDTCSPAERTASFTGRMESVRRARQMAMRFTILERFGTAPFARVEAPGLDVWHKSRRGVRVFAYTQRITALRDAGSYRARVRFRWFDAKGRRILSRSRRSPACRQPGPLPNLRIGKIAARRGPVDSTVIYSVNVLNVGVVEARKVSVVVTVDGAALDARQVEVMGPGERRTLQFTGPVCERGVRAAVDPKNDIGELVEEDNVRSLPCDKLRS